MNNVIDSLPEQHRETFVLVLREKDPELLEVLLSRQVPTLAAWDKVQELFIDAFSEHYGPGHEPTETGMKIDNALGAFLIRWPRDMVEGEAGQESEFGAQVRSTERVVPD